MILSSRVFDDCCQIVLARVAGCCGLRVSGDRLPKPEEINFGGSGGRSVVRT
jgi:hypothetical protein